MEEKHLNSGKETLIDRFGRVHDYLRISLTDQCNLRCSYCMPMHPVFMPKNSILSSRELTILASTFVDLGINKIRITGGEPLFRKDFPELIEGISKLQTSLHLTTNGYYVNDFLSILKKNFTSVNVSLDTLKNEKFKTITHRNALERTLQNIDLLIKEGIKTKINVVVVRNVNEDEICDFIELTKLLPVEIRFIEFMPFSGNRWKLAQTFSHEEMVSMIKSKYTIEITGKAKNETAFLYRVKGYAGNFGIISTVSHPFCSDCNRIRITADGKMKNCLFDSGEIDLRPYLNRSEKLVEAIRSGINRKHYSYGGKSSMSDKNSAHIYGDNRSMTSIGG